MPGPDAHGGRRRTIRSFVRRAGRLTASQQRAIDELWPAFGVDYSAAQLDFDRLFDRSAARVLEIGFGNGETLVQQALENPALDFIGIEVHEPGIGHCLIAARKAGIGNLRLWHTNEFDHNGLRAAGERVLGRLLDLLHGEA